MSRKKRINEALYSNLSPQRLIIEDESHNHHVPENAESHFKIIIVTDAFSGINRIERHRLINTLLADEFNQGLHALSLHLYSPQEWFTRGQQPPASPPCQQSKIDT
ncbi:MAG: BolA family protein [Legionella sp.]